MAANPSPEKVWRQRVRAWKRSGLTVGEYAAREGFNAATLSWWKWHLQTRAGRDPKGGLSFVEVGAAVRGAVSSEAADSGFDLQVGAHVRVRVPYSFDAAALTRLLDVLERRA